MAEIELAIKDTETEPTGGNALELFSGVGSLAVPNNFKVGRHAQLQLAKVERDLFTDEEEKLSGNYIVSGLSKAITQVDFQAYSMAIAQTLFNQSYQSGNKEENTGLTKRQSNNLTTDPQHPRYMGDIVVSLEQLCKYAYGVEEASTKQRKAMATIIDSLDSTPVTITFPNGDTKESYISKKMEVFRRAKDKAVFYNLYLHPIFCENVAKNFAELPQDVTQRLALATKGRGKGATAAHYSLLQLLSRQDKRKPFKRTIEQLLTDLWLTDSYKKDRSREEKKLLAIFDSMVQIGIISSYTVERVQSTKKNPPISKVTFILNPNFIKEGETTPEQQKAEASPNK